MAGALAALEREGAPPAPQTIVVLGGFAESLIGFRGALIARMVAAGHRVIACAPAGGPEVAPGLAALGAEFRAVPLARAGLRPDRDLATLWALRRLFLELRPDILFAYTIKPVIWGTLAARLAGVPRRFAMITGLGYAFGGSGAKARLVGRVVRALYRASLAGSERVLFQNPDDRAVFVRLGLVRGAEHTVTVNGSGVDLEAFRPAPLPERVSFLLIARLIASKGIREYVAAARRLRARWPGTSFALVGWIDRDNPEAITAEELAGWVAEGVIDYRGRLADVRPALAACAVFVLPTGYPEGTPRTALEALAMGRPVVTTDAPGCRETVIEGENGYLVPPRDVDALCRALERFLEDPALVARMGAASRRLAARKYDVHAVNRTILAVMGLGS